MPATYIVIVEESIASPVARPRKRSKKAVPPIVLASLPKNQRRPLQSKVKAIGGWDDGAACHENARKPRKTWRSTKQFAREIENEAGLDFGAMDPAPIKDPFCKPLELRGKRCPDTNAKGGVTKAVRIGLGSKNRRLADLPDRPQWQKLNEALQETQGVTLHPNALQAVELHAGEVRECKTQHADKRDDLLVEAKRGRLKPRAKVPF